MGSSNSKVSDSNDGLQPTPVYYSKSLEMLDGLNLVRIQQQLPRDLKQCCHGNTFKIFKESGEPVLRAIEKPFCNNCCSRWICGPARGFVMVFYDNNRRPIIHLKRLSCRCDAWCCLDCVFCNHKMVVLDGDRNHLGSVKQKFGCCNPHISLEDANAEEVARVRGPCCPSRCCCDMTFNVFTPSGSGPSIVNDVAITSQPGSVASLGSAGSFAENFYYSGKVEKKWQKSSYPSVNMDHENVILRIPDDMDTVERALMFGAAFLVDYMYFEVS